MPAALHVSPAVPPQLTGVRRKKFTRAEVDRIEETGILAGQRYELIDGDLIDKMGQNPPHAISISLLNALLSRLFGLQLRVQAPIEVAVADQRLNFPEPDLVVTSSVLVEYQERHPRGDELLLLVEVADSSVIQDTIVKRDLYARAGVPDYWVLDIPGRRMIVHRKPAHGVYAEVITLLETEEIALPGKPETMMSVASLLPSAKR